MALIDPPNIVGPAIEVVCACSAEFSDYASFYRHVGDCKLDRCSRCLEWLDGTHATIETHTCAAIKLMNLKTELRKLVRRDER